jgi:multiple sugar transport system permease protein
MATTYETARPQAIAIPRRRRGMSKLARREALVAYLILAPNIIGFLIFIILPIIFNLPISLLEWSGFSPLENAKFVGAQNFLTALNDKLFQKAVLNTFYYSFTSVPLTVALSLFFAMLLNQKLRGVAVYRTIYFIPVATMLVAIAMVWNWLLDANYGLINFVLQSMGDGVNALLALVHLPKWEYTLPGWTADPDWAMPAVILVSVWKSLGFNIIFFLAGLQQIPEMYYEAVTIDGAGRWQKFWNITLPLVSPTTFFVVVIAIINSFQVFDQVYVMTKGGPAHATLTMVMYLYQNGFSFNKMGYAAAQSWILFVFIMMATLVQLYFQRRWVHYE